MIRFQIRYRCEGVQDVEAILKNALKKSAESNYLELDDNEWIAISYRLKAGDGELLGFDIDISEYENVQDHYPNLIEAFIEELKTTLDVTWLGKFYDSENKSKTAEFIQEIYDIEMRLREVLTFIFMSRYPDDPYNLFSEYNLIAKSDHLKQIKDTTKREGVLKPVFENEFFHILFSDYQSLDSRNLKSLDHKDVLGYITTAENFEHFQVSLASRGIQDNDHQDFIASIKASLDSVEKFRNCIAHNRAYTEVELENYQKSKNDLEKHIEEFWEKATVSDGYVKEDKC